MAATIFWPTSSTNQKWPMAKIFMYFQSNLDEVWYRGSKWDKDNIEWVWNSYGYCVFHPILMKFGNGDIVGQKTISNESEMATAIFNPYSIADHYSFQIFTFQKIYRSGYHRLSVLHWSSVIIFFLRGNFDALIQAWNYQKRWLSPQGKII